MISMKNVIVTGATGFIGSWLVNELLNNEAFVTVVVRDKDKLLPEILSNSKCMIIEKNAKEIEAKDFLDKKYDAFYHFAWSGVSPECKNNYKVQIDNISMSLHVLEVCNQIGCKRFIASGTAAEYVFCSDVMNVHARQCPNDLYGAAKASAYYFLEVRARQLRQHFIWIIIPSTFGERRKDNNIITYTIRTLLKAEKPQYGDLKQKWDFLYVSEAVKAIRLIGEKGKTEHIYGIGSGQYRSLRIGEIPAMSNQTFSSCVNIDDLVKDTGFTPKISFEDGIKKTIKYLRNEG